MGCRWGRSDYPLFLRIFPLFLRISPLFLRIFPLFLRFSLLLLKDKGKQQQFTAKMGNFTPTPSAPTPCKTSRLWALWDSLPQRAKDWTNSRFQSGTDREWPRYCWKVYWTKMVQKWSKRPLCYTRAVPEDQGDETLRFWGVKIVVDLWWQISSENKLPFVILNPPERTAEKCLVLQKKSTFLQKNAQKCNSRVAYRRRPQEIAGEGLRVKNQER